MALSMTKDKPKTTGKPVAKGKGPSFGKGKKATSNQPVKHSKKVQAEMDKPFVAVLPKVNLLSPVVQAQVEERRLKRLFAVLVVVAIALVATAWGLQAAMIAVAENKLADEQAKAADLTAKQAELAPVQAFYGQIDANAATIASTMSSEVLTSEIIAGIDEVNPAGLSIDSLGLTVQAAGTTGGAVDPTVTTSSCPSQDPYSGATPSAGCINVSGTATSREVLGKWLDNIEAHELFTVAFIPNTTSDSQGGKVTFAATVGLDPVAAFKNRYANPEFLKAGNK